MTISLSRSDAQSTIASAQAFRDSLTPGNWLLTCVSSTIEPDPSDPHKSEFIVRFHLPTSPIFINFTVPLYDGQMTELGARKVDGICEVMGWDELPTFTQGEEYEIAVVRDHRNSKFWRLDTNYQASSLTPGRESPDSGSDAI